MMDELKKILLAGVGSAAYTYEKASEMVDSLVKKGQITMEQGKELSEELKKTVKDTGDKILPVTRESLEEIIKEMNLVTREEFDALQLRLAVLEDKINSAKEES